MAAIFVCNLSHSDNFAAAVLDEVNDDGGSSEFDDFSDGDEQVNIIKVVNGIPSPVPPPPPATLPPTEEEEEAEAAAALEEVEEPVARAESSSSPGRNLPSFLPCPRHFLLNYFEFDRLIIKILKVHHKLRLHAEASLDKSET